MAVNVAKLGGAKVYNYHYDQLNRLVAMDVYDGLNKNPFTTNQVNYLAKAINKTIVDQ